MRKRRFYTFVILPRHHKCENARSTLISRPMAKIVRKRRSYTFVALPGKNKCEITHSTLISRPMAQISAETPVLHLSPASWSEKVRNQPFYTYLPLNDHNKCGNASFTLLPLLGQNKCEITRSTLISRPMARISAETPILHFCRTAWPK